MKLNTPVNLEIDSAGNLYFSETIYYNTNVIRRIDYNTGLVSTYAGVPFEEWKTGDDTSGDRSSVKL